MRMMSYRCGGGSSLGRSTENTNNDDTTNNELITRLPSVRLSVLSEDV